VPVCRIVIGDELAACPEFDLRLGERIGERVFVDLTYRISAQKDVLDKLLGQEYRIPD
jgi:hypothetical protein